MAVSIEDVAKRADVSISTVSRVLNRRNIVNDKTRKRVEIAIQELGYRPNVFARGLMLRRSNILGLVLPDLHGEFYSEIIRGANMRAHELGYQLMISSVVKGDAGKNVLSAVTEHGLVDGLAVMVSEVNASTRKTLENVKIPMVVLDGDVEGVKHDSVVIDQRQGTSALIEHLINDRGAKRVVFVGGNHTNIDTMERSAAFLDVMTKAGLPVSSSDIHHLDFTHSTAFDLGLKLVRDWAKDNASIFAANDEMAAGIVHAAIEMGVSVPDDIRVVGFDDTRIAQMTRPRLTTVHVPMSNMGAGAVELLCQRLDDQSRTPTKLTLQAELIVRESCGSTL